MALACPNDDELEDNDDGMSVLAKMAVCGYDSLSQSQPQSKGFTAKLLKLSWDLKLREKTHWC